MDTAVKTTRAENEEIRLREVVDILWRGKWFIAAATIAFGLAAAVYAWVTPKTYEASTVLSPVTNTPGEGSLSGLGSLASQFGGLASLAGISLGTDSRRAESIAFLQSDALTRKYIEENDLLPVLYDGAWDAREKRWKVDSPAKVPTLWQATRFFKRGIRTVTTDNKTGLVTLTVAWHDPRAAAKWANDLVTMTNGYLRDQAIAQADRDIAYLNGEAEKTNVVEARQAIFTVLQNELNKSMLARGSQEYAFKVIDPATAPERQASPRPRLWTAVGLFIGLLVSSFLVFLRAAMF
jgi:uncharacterized protein involved in exopolysaccharide biosynthesis